METRTDIRNTIKLLDRASSQWQNSFPTLPIVGTYELSVTDSGIENGINKLSSDSGLICCIHFSIDSLEDKRDFVSSSPQLWQSWWDYLALDAYQPNRKKTLHFKPWTKQQQTTPQEDLTIQIIKEKSRQVMITYVLKGHDSLKKTIIRMIFLLV